MPGKTVGLIGIGLVGSALAERFFLAGWHVVGFDLNRDSCDRFQVAGGVVANSPDDVINKTQTIVFSLPTSTVAQHVLAGLSVSLEGKTIVDTTTGEPDAMSAIGESLHSRGARYLDATIAGSSAQVRIGDVIVLVGGDIATYQDCIELFQSFSTRTFHLGGWGSGARMKLVVNLVLGLNRAVLAEGLCFAERTGVDPQIALEVLKAGPTYSRVMDTKGRKMLDADFAPQARLAQHLKDVRLILSTGAANHALLPLSNLHEDLLNQLDQAGFGDLDNSAIIKSFQSHRLIE